MKRKEQIAHRLDLIIGLIGGHLHNDVEMDEIWEVNFSDEAEAKKLFDRYIAKGWKYFSTHDKQVIMNDLKISLEESEYKFSERQFWDVIESAFVPLKETDNPRKVFEWLYEYILELEDKQA